MPERLRLCPPRRRDRCGSRRYPFDDPPLSHHPREFLPSCRGDQTRSTEETFHDLDRTPLRMLTCGVEVLCRFLDPTPTFGSTGRRFLLNALPRSFRTCHSEEQCSLRSPSDGRALPPLVLPSTHHQATKRLARADRHSSTSSCIANHVRTWRMRTRGLRSGASGFVKVFGCRPTTDRATRTWAGVRKPPREETAGWVGDLVPRVRRGAMGI